MEGHAWQLTLLECADVSKTTIRAASSWQSHSVRPQTLAVTSPLDADKRKGTYTQARDRFLRTTPSALPGRQNCAVDQYLHLFFFKLAHFLSQLEVTCMRRKLSAANQQSEPHGFGNHTVSDHKHYPRPRRWALGQHYPQPRRWTLGQHYPRPRKWTLTQGMEQTRMKGQAWQLTLF